MNDVTQYIVPDTLLIMQHSKYSLYIVECFAYNNTMAKINFGATGTFGFLGWVISPLDTRRRVLWRATILFFVISTMVGVAVWMLLRFTSNVPAVVGAWALIGFAGLFVIRFVFDIYRLGKNNFPETPGTIEE